jgi:hypothetical protein
LDKNKNFYHFAIKKVNKLKGSMKIFKRPRKSMILKEINSKILFKV